MMKLALLAGGLVGAICAGITWLAGDPWLKIVVIHTVSGLSAFVALVLLATFRGAFVSEDTITEEIEADLLALRESARIGEDGQDVPPDILIRAHRLHRQMNSRLPRSTFGG